MVILDKHYSHVDPNLCDFMWNTKRDVLNNVHTDLFYTTQAYIQLGTRYAVHAFMLIMLNVR